MFNDSSKEVSTAVTLPFSEKLTKNLLYVGLVAIGIGSLLSFDTVSAGGPNSGKEPNPDHISPNKGEVQPNGPYMKRKGQKGDPTATPVPGKTNQAESSDYSIVSPTTGHRIYIPIVFNPSKDELPKVEYQDPYPQP